MAGSNQASGLPASSVAVVPLAVAVSALSAKLTESLAPL